MARVPRQIRATQSAGFVTVEIETCVKAEVTTGVYCAFTLNNNAQCGLQFSVGGAAILLVNSGIFTKHANHSGHH